MQDLRAVRLNKLHEHDKLPSEIIICNTVEAEENGITEFKCAAFRSYTYDRYTYLDINGEYSGKVSHYTVILFLIYNGNGELIGANFDKEIPKKFRKKQTFSLSIEVPIDEYISKISIRFIPDPAWL